MSNSSSLDYETVFPWQMESTFGQQIITIYPMIGDTKAAHVRWNQGHNINWDIPSGHRDFSGYSYLEVRVGQLFGAWSCSVPDFQVRLSRLPFVWSSPVNVSDYQTIACPDDYFPVYPDDPALCGPGSCNGTKNFTKNTLVTIRIPLDDFDVSLSSIYAVRFSPTTFGELLIDDLRLSH